MKKMIILLSLLMILIFNGQVVSESVSAPTDDHIPPFQTVAALETPHSPTTSESVTAKETIKQSTSKGEERDDTGRIKNDEERRRDTVLLSEDREGAEQPEAEPCETGEDDCGADGGDERDLEEDESEDAEGTGGPVYLGAWTITAYCNCEICCGDYAGGCTASGTIPCEGRTVACNILPMGSQVMIGDGVYIVEDTGWSPYDEWADIYFDSHETALAFGQRTMDVYLIS